MLLLSIFVVVAATGSFIRSLRFNKHERTIKLREEEEEEEEEEVFLCKVNFNRSH